MFKREKKVVVEEKQSVAKAAFYYLICQVLVNGMVFIVTPIFTRMMSKEDYGIVSSFLAWESMLFPIITLNLRTTITRSKYVFSNENDTFLSSILATSNLFTVIVYLFIELNKQKFVDFFGMDIMYIRVLMLYILFKSAFEYQQIQFKNYHKYKLFVFYSVVSVFSSLILSIVLVQTMDNKLNGRLWGIVFPSIIINLFVLIDIWRRGKRIDFNCVKFALKMGIPLIPSALSASLLSSSDRVMISKYCTNEETALYSTAYNVYFIAAVIWTALQQAWEPWLNDNLASKNYENIKKYSKLLVIVYGILVVGIMLVSPEIILFLGGKDYYEAIWVMPPVILAMVFQFLYTFYFNIEYFYGETYVISAGTFMAACINLILNRIFIPQFGYLAASYTTLVSYAIMFFYHYLIVKKKLKKDYIFDNKHLFGMIIVLMILQILIAFMYKVYLLRYAFILLYMIISFWYFGKRNDFLKNLFKKNYDV